MKKLFALLGSVCSLGAFAADGDGAMDQITAKVATELGNWTNSITSFFTTNFTTIATVLGIALGVTVLWVVFKLFSKGAKKVG